MFVQYEQLKISNISFKIKALQTNALAGKEREHTMEFEKAQNTINLDEKFKELLREVDNKEEFFRFLCFCFLRLQRCDQVQEIWNDWTQASD